LKDFPLLFTFVLRAMKLGLVYFVSNKFLRYCYVQFVYIVNFFTHFVSLTYNNDNNLS